MSAREARRTLLSGRRNKGGKQIFGLLLDGGNFEDLNVPLGRQFDLENRSRLVFGRIKEIKT